MHLIRFEVFIKVYIILKYFLLFSIIKYISLLFITFSDTNGIDVSILKSSDDEYTSHNPYNKSDDGDGIKYAKTNETIEIYPSIISTYYFSAISIIGLYILYNLLYKKK